jgi:hypothetical protein
MLPKVKLYNQAEAMLAKSDIIIDGEQVNDKGFYLTVENPTLYFKQIESAKAEHVDITTLGCINYLRIEKIKLNELFSSFFPLNIENLELEYSVIRPLHILINASGDFGFVKGSIKLDDAYIELSLHPTEMMIRDYSKTLEKFSKDSDGGYVYAHSF